LIRNLLRARLIGTIVLYFCVIVIVIIIALVVVTQRLNLLEFIFVFPIICKAIRVIGILRARIIVRVNINVRYPVSHMRPHYLYLVFTSM
jgi:hypothetical protein